MKLISWNVNGLRAAMSKNFMEFLTQEDPDVMCVQETKMQESQKTFAFDGYYEYWSSAEKKGYSGTLVLSKEKPLNVMYGVDSLLYNDEGRVITLEYEDFHLVNVYSPNSQHGLLRLDYRMQYENDLKNFLKKLDAIKPVVLCGDLNVAHTEMDLKNPKSNEKNPGYTLEERTKFTDLLDAGFIDTFRTLYPDKIEYSWWSYRFKAREKNIGWRIDYFVASKRLEEHIKEATIKTDVLGSDHCPVTLELSINLD